MHNIKHIIKNLMLCNEINLILLTLQSKNMINLHIFINHKIK